MLRNRTNREPDAYEELTADPDAQRWQSEYELFLQEQEQLAQDTNYLERPRRH